MVKGLKKEDKMLNKNIIAIGGQGFLKECLHYVQQIPDITLKGFVSFEQFVPDVGKYNSYYLGDFADYNPMNNDNFIICAGTPELRKKIFYSLEEKGVTIVNLLYNSKINSTVNIGIGNVFVNCDITVDITVGNGNLFNNRTMIAHDVNVGNFNCIAPNNQLLGKCHLGNENSIGTSCIIFPKAKIGNKVTLAPSSVVYKFCKDNYRYIGNPAIKMGEIF